MMPYFCCPFVSVGYDCTNVPQTYFAAPQYAPQAMQLPAQAMTPEMPYALPMSPFYQSPGFPMPYLTDEYMDFEEIDFEPATASPGDPPPVLSNNPAIATIALFKELTGYPNYGNPSGNADILYTGNRGVWTFDVPAFLFVPGNLRAQIFIRGVLDDHSSVPVNRYSARITINGTVVHTGAVPLEHGVPAGGRFTNWRLLTFDVSNLRRSNRVEIVNTSNTGADDWIGLDWMELRLLPR